MMVVGWGLPSILRSKGVPTEALLSSLTAATAVQAAATLFGGWLGDRVGRRKLYCLSSLALGLGTWVYFHALFHATSATRLYPLYAANILYLGVAYGVMQGAFPALLVEIFPEKVRYSGISFLYHVSRVYSSGIWPFLSRALLAAGRKSHVGYTQAGVAATEASRGREEEQNVVGIVAYVSCIALFSAVSVLMIQIYSLGGGGSFRLTGHRRSKVRNCVAGLPRRARQRGEEKGGDEELGGEGEMKMGGGRGRGRGRRRVGRDGYEEEAAAIRREEGEEDEDDEWDDSYGEESEEEEEEYCDDSSVDWALEMPRRGRTLSNSSFRSSVSHEEEESAPAPAPASAGRLAARGPIVRVQDGL